MTFFKAGLILILISIIVAMHPKSTPQTFMLKYPFVVGLMLVIASFSMHMWNTLP